MKLAFIFVLFLIGAPLTAGDPPSLFEAVSAKAAGSFQSLPVRGVLQETVVAVDLVTVAANPERLRVSLFDGETYFAVRKRAVQRADGRLSWYGEVRRADQPDEPPLGFLSLSVLHERLSAVLHVGESRYVIVPGSSGLHRLARVSESADICGIEERGSRESLPRQKGGAGIGLGSERETVTVDVMALYTNDFTVNAATEMDAQTYINQVVNLANDVFANSQVNVRYELVHMGPISQNLSELEDIFPTPPSPTLHPVTVAREWLNEEPLELKNMRNQYGADMVALFIPMQPDFPCGVANMPRLVGGQENIRRFHPTTFFEPFNQRAYMAVALGCGPADFTYAHEHGHNFGMDHDPSGLVVPGFQLIHPFARGHVLHLIDKKGNPYRRASVMGCTDFTGGGPGQIACNRIAHFSNPEVLYEGVPTGIPESDPNDPGRDNAQMADLRAPQYAAFRPCGGDAPPTIRITGPADGSTVIAGQTVTLTAVATDAEDGPLTGTIAWDSDLEPITGTGSPVIVTFNAFGEHQVTAMVTDSAGSMAFATIRLTVLDPTMVPDIRVTLAATGEEIPNGGTFTFPDTPVEDLPISRLFRIHNDGDGDLVFLNPGNLVSGTGFSQIGTLPVSTVPPNPGGSTTFRVRFHVSSAGTYTGTVFIDTNDPDEDPFTFTLEATAPLVKFVASYKPSQFGARTTFASQSVNPPSFDFYHDPSLGSFEERPDGICHEGRDNPTYLEVKLDSNVTIDSCTYQASWDSGPTTCNQDVLDALNSGEWNVINTDNYLHDTGTCDTAYPPDAHVLPFVPHWLHVSLVSGNLAFERRLNFRKGFEVYDVRLEAEYKPSPGAPREEFESGEPFPAEIISYYYNPGLGNFEERPGGACHTGQNNSTYFEVSLESEKPIQDCDFQASWDSGSITCSAFIRDQLNAGTQIVINTDTYGIDPGTCQLTQPLDPHVFPGVNHWLRVTFYINGRAYERRVNFVKQ